MNDRERPKGRTFCTPCLMCIKTLNYNQTFIALNLVNRLQAAIIISITNTVCSQGGSITKATAQ